MMRLHRLNTYSSCGLAANVAGLLVFLARVIPSTRFRIAVFGILSVMVLVALVLLLWREEVAPAEQEMNWQEGRQVIKNPHTRYYLHERERLNILFVLGAVLVAAVGALT